MRRVARPSGIASSRAATTKQPPRRRTTPTRSPTPPSTAADATGGNASATAPSAAANRHSSRVSGPQFGYLVLAALDAIGVTYISMDHLRKAKKGTVSEREYLELWKLLHDLVLVVLANFDVDADEMRSLNAREELEATLWDCEAQQLRVELVRFYLHHWGFVCSSFYDQANSSQLPQSSDLLLATAWLFAFSDFFERLHVPILERCVGASRESFVLPPYPNDVVLSPAQQAHAVATARAAVSSVDIASRSDAFETLVQQLHTAVGRLQSHVNELQAYVRYHARLLAKLETRQLKSLDERDAVVPASVVQLLAQPKAALERHVQLLAQRVQMIDDEQLFYKWVNGLVATYPTVTGAADVQDSDAPSSVSAQLATKFPSLYAHVRSLQALVQDHKSVLETLRANYTRAFRAFQQTARASQQQQMALKMERLATDVAARELMDPQTLFRESRRQQQTTRRGRSETVATPEPTPLATEQDLASLRNQLTRVLTEISTAYCHAELQ